MKSSIFSGIGIDPGIIVIVLAILTLISFIASVICFSQYRKLYRRYDMFMRGKDAETLEDTIMELVDETEYLRAKDGDTKRLVDSVVSKAQAGYQKTGIVKYNAFKGMGGNLSFVIAMLDDNNTGFVLNSVHSREGCYLYLKDVVEGKTEVLLGSEEKEALERALGYK